MQLHTLGPVTAEFKCVFNYAQPLLFRSLCGLRLHVHARSLAKLDLFYWHSRLCLLFACTCSSMHSVQRPAKRSRIKWCRLSLAAMSRLIFCHDSIHSKKTEIYIILLLCTLGAMYVLLLRRGGGCSTQTNIGSLKINAGNCRRLLMIADLASRTKLGAHVHACAHDLTQRMKWHHSSTRMRIVMIKGEQIYRPAIHFRDFFSTSNKLSGVGGAKGSFKLVGKNHNEKTNWFVLHCVSRPGRSIVRKNKQPKETRPWHIIREGRKEGFSSRPRYTDYRSRKAGNVRSVLRAGF